MTLVKTLCGSFNQDKFLYRLVEDVFNDFKYCTDVKEELQIISGSLKHTEVQALESVRCIFL